MIDVLIFVVVVLIVFGATLENIRLKNKNVELMFLVAQSHIDNGIIKQKLTTDKDVEKDHLITFLSDTRDIAFTEIEKLQKHIRDFVDFADTQFAFFDEHKNLLQEYPYYETMKSMSDEYKKLKLLIPEEDINGR